MRKIRVRATVNLYIEANDKVGTSDIIDSWVQRCCYIGVMDGQALVTHVEVVNMEATDSR